MIDPNTLLRGRLNPQLGECKLDRFEGLDANYVFTPEGAYKDPSSAVEPKNFDRLFQGVNYPNMLHSMLGIERKFLDSIDTRGAGRQNFAYPVGSDVEVG